MGKSEGELQYREKLPIRKRSQEWTLTTHPDTVFVGDSGRVIFRRDLPFWSTPNGETLIKRAPHPWMEEEMLEAWDKLELSLCTASPVSGYYTLPYGKDTAIAPVSPNRPTPFYPLGKVELCVWITRMQPTHIGMWNGKLGALLWTDEDGLVGATLSFKPNPSFYAWLVPDECTWWDIVLEKGKFRAVPAIGRDDSLGCVHADSAGAAVEQFLEDESE